MAPPLPSKTDLLGHLEGSVGRACDSGKCNDLGVASSRPTLGVEITYIDKTLKNINDKTKMGLLPLLLFLLKTIIPAIAFIIY